MNDNRTLVRWDYNSADTTTVATGYLGAWPIFILKSSNDYSKVHTLICSLPGLRPAIKTCVSEQTAKDKAENIANRWVTNAGLFIEGY